MEYDPESYVEQSLPLLVVGTKSDQMPPTKTPPTTNLQGAICININCTNSRQFAIGSAELIQFNKFFDKVTTLSLLTHTHTHTHTLSSSLR